MSIDVLLVDDQRIVGEAIRRILASEADIKFHFHQQGLTAIAQANQIHPAVILQDMVLADIDGLALVQQFRANPGTKTTPLIVLTSRESSAVENKALAAGANEYMLKPPDRALLISRIRHYATPVATPGAPAANPPAANPLAASPPVA